jgi:hypothetical protein
VGWSLSVVYTEVCLTTCGWQATVEELPLPPQVAVFAPHVAASVWFVSQLDAFPFGLAITTELIIRIAIRTATLFTRFFIFRLPFPR